MRVIRPFMLMSVVLGTLAAPAAAQTGVELTTDYPVVAVERGETATFPLEVAAPAAARVDLTVSQVPEGWGATLRGGGFVVGAVTADADEPAEVSLDVDVPIDAAEGAYQVVVEASGQAGAASLALELRVSDAAAGAVTLTAEFPSLEGASDASFNFDPTLDNATPEETTFSLEAEAPRGWIATARPSGESQASTATVEGGQSESISVEVDPPDDTPAGSYPVVVRAVGGDRTAETELTVEVTGNFAMRLTTPDERLNARVTAGQAQDVQLLVVNDGTAPLVGVTFSASPPSGWDVSFSPEVVEQVMPGEFTEVTATITASGDAVAGDYIVTLDADTPETSATMDLRTTVETSRLWGVVGVGLIGAAFAGLGWVFRRFGRR